MLQLYETQESKRKNIIGLLEFQKDMKKMFKRHSLYIGLEMSILGAANTQSRFKVE
jgi:hypothetical protein